MSFDFGDFLEARSWSETVSKLPAFLQNEYETDRDRFWIRLAYRTAMHESDDPSTQNGAVIIKKQGGFPIIGANRFARAKSKTPERLERPAKYSWIEHAERVAILTAGTGLRGATMYSPWSACSECARAIIFSGITELVGHQEIHDKTPERWRESIEVANQMLDEAGVKRRMVSGKIGGVRVLFDGQHWEP